MEGDANLRLKGENGLLRKRFDEQLKAIEECKGALRCGAGVRLGRQQAVIVAAGRYCRRWCCVTDFISCAASAALPGTAA